MQNTLEKRPDHDEKLIQSETGPTAVSTLTDDIIRRAADPATPPDALVGLATECRNSLGGLIAANPNTPPEVLHQLWLVHPLASLENPILAYRALSTGGPFHELLPGEVKLALYDTLRKDCRDEELETLLPVHDRTNWLRHNPNGDPAAKLPPELRNSVYRHLATDASPDVRRAMLDRLPIGYLHDFTADPDFNIRLALAKKLSGGHFVGSSRDAKWDAVVDSLCTDPDERVRAVVATSAILTANAHMTLAVDPCLEVRKNLAEKGGGHELPQAGWRILISEGDLLCHLVAQNRACPVSVRLDLTGHPDTRVRMKAWEKLNFDTCRLADKLAGKLEILFSDPPLEAERRVLAGNQTITRPVIQSLLRCEASVTRELAENEMLTDDVRLFMLQQDDIETAVIAVRHAFQAVVLNTGFRHRSPQVRVEVAGLTGRHPTTLRFKLAVDPSTEVRQAVRKYLMENIPTYDGCNIRETLRILSHDPLAKIRAAVIKDHRLARSERDRLGADPSVRVRIEVLKLLSPCPRSHLGLLDHKSARVRLMAARLIMRSGPVHDGWHTKRCAQFDAKIAADPSPLVRSVAAGSAFTSVAVLGKLIRDEAPEVLETLAQLNLPRSSSALDSWVDRFTPRVLKQLEGSRNPYCRAVAASSRIAGKKRQQRMASDRCWFVRLMLARNGHLLDHGILQKLAADAHPLVRRAAEGRIHPDQASALRPAKGGRP